VHDADTRWEQSRDAHRESLYGNSVWEIIKLLVAFDSSSRTKDGRAEWRPKIAVNMVGKLETCVVDLALEQDQTC
jgi:hypothetical protein